MSKAKYELCLYIRGETPQSQHNIAQLQAICEAQLHGEYTLTVVDLKDNMQLAEDHQIFALPTLERRRPKPLRRVVGDLSNVQNVLFSLDIANVSASQYTGGIA
jgi:circadian clock protein KaiB